MSGGYTAEDMAIASSTTVGASQTNSAISKPFVITAYGATKAIRVEVLVSAVTVAVGVTAKLQHAVKRDGDTATWADVAGGSAALTTTGYASIILNACDSTDSPAFPLRPNGRVVVTTGAGDSVTVTEVQVIQEK